MAADLRFYDKQTMKIVIQALEWAPERKVKHLRTQVTSLFVAIVEFCAYLG
jgi:hypothetical protein